jgi:hypothetical protein
MVMSEINANIREYQLNIFGLDGSCDKVDLPDCGSEVEAVLEALAVQAAHAVELRQGQRCVLRVALSPPR